MFRTLFLGLVLTGVNLTSNLFSNQFLNFSLAQIVVGQPFPASDRLRPSRRLRRRPARPAASPPPRALPQLPTTAASDHCCLSSRQRSTLLYQTQGEAPSVNTVVQRRLLNAGPWLVSENLGYILDIGKLPLTLSEQHRDSRCFGLPSTFLWYFEKHSIFRKNLNKITAGLVCEPASTRLEMVGRGHVVGQVRRLRSKAVPGLPLDPGLACVTEYGPPYIFSIRVRHRTLAEHGRNIARCALLHSVNLTEGIPLRSGSE